MAPAAAAVRAAEEREFGWRQTRLHLKLLAWLRNYSTSERLNGPGGVVRASISDEMLMNSVAAGSGVHLSLLQERDWFTAPTTGSASLNPASEIEGFNRGSRWCFIVSSVRMKKMRTSKASLINGALD